MNYANISTQAQRTGTIPGGTYGDLDYHGEPPWHVAHAAGWRMLDDRAEFTPPDGFAVTGYTYEQDGARDDYALEVPTVTAIPVPTPQYFAAGIETPLLVLEHEETGKGVGYVADEDGALVPVLYAHESPYDMAALKAKITAAKAAHAGKKADAANAKAAWLDKGGKGNLQERIEAIEAWINAQEGAE
jgi:hypothetical protein